MSAEYKRIWHGWRLQADIQGRGATAAHAPAMLVFEVRAGERWGIAVWRQLHVWDAGRHHARHEFVRVDREGGRIHSLDEGRG